MTLKIFMLLDKTGHYDAVSATNLQKFTFVKKMQSQILINQDERMSWSLSKSINHFSQGTLTIVKVQQGPPACGFSSR